MWMSHEERWRVVTNTSKYLVFWSLLKKIRKSLNIHIHKTQGEKKSAVSQTWWRLEHSTTSGGKKCALSHNQSESWGNLCPLLQRQFQKDLFDSLLFKSLPLRMLFGLLPPPRFPRRAQGRAKAVFPPSSSGMKSFKLLSNPQSFQNSESGQQHFLLPISMCGHLSTRPCCCLSPYYFLLASFLLNSFLSF